MSRRTLMESERSNERRRIQNRQNARDERRRKREERRKRFRKTNSSGRSNSNSNSHSPSKSTTHSHSKRSKVRAQSVVPSLPPPRAVSASKKKKKKKTAPARSAHNSHSANPSDLKVFIWHHFLCVFRRNRPFYVRFSFFQKRFRICAFRKFSLFLLFHLFAFDAFFVRHPTRSTPLDSDAP